MEHDDPRNVAARNSSTQTRTGTMATALSDAPTAQEKPVRRMPELRFADRHPDARLAAKAKGST